MYFIRQISTCMPLLFKFLPFCGKGLGPANSYPWAMLAIHAPRHTYILNITFETGTEN